MELTVFASLLVVILGRVAVSAHLSESSLPTTRGEDRTLEKRRARWAATVAACVLRKKSPSVAFFAPGRFSMSLVSRAYKETERRVAPPNTIQYLRSPSRQSESCRTQNNSWNKPTKMLWEDMLKLLTLRTNSR